MFTGYTDQTVDIFWGIRFNNDRAWFAEHKQEFQDAVMAPTKALAAELYDWFQADYPDLHLNLHISRIYRDARRLFGRGPLNDHIWFSFQNAIENRGEAPCFWFQVGADGYGCGAGWWMPAASGVQLRRLLDHDPARGEKLLRNLDAQDAFTLSGPAYARPKGHAAEPLGRLYNLRSFSLESMHPFDARSSSAALTDWVKDGFRFLLPYYQLFEQAYGMVDCAYFFFRPFRKTSARPTRIRPPPTSFRSVSASACWASSAPPTAHTAPAAAAGQTARQTIWRFLI